MYDLSASTLESWLKTRSILIEARRTGCTLLVNEADVAYCAYVHHKYGKRGVTTFNEDRTPFKPKPKNMLLR
jgi:hypothetical protein